MCVFTPLAKIFIINCPWALSRKATYVLFLWHFSIRYSIVKFLSCISFRFLKTLWDFIIRMPSIEIARYLFIPAFHIKYYHHKLLPFQSDTYSGSSFRHWSGFSWDLTVHSVNNVNEKYANYVISTFRRRMSFDLVIQYTTCTVYVLK